MGDARYETVARVGPHRRAYVLFVLPAITPFEPWRRVINLAPFCPQAPLLTIRLRCASVIRSGEGRDSNQSHGSTMIGGISADKSRKQRSDRRSLPGCSCRRFATSFLTESYVLHKSFIFLHFYPNLFSSNRNKKTNRTACNLLKRNNSGHSESQQNRTFIKEKQNRPPAAFSASLEAGE